MGSELFTLFSHFTFSQDGEEEEAARKFSTWYLKESPDLFKIIIEELREVVKEKRVPWEEIHRADFDFKNEETAKEWLKKILDVLEEENAKFHSQN